MVKLIIERKSSPSTMEALELLTVRLENIHVPEFDHANFILALHGIADAYPKERSITHSHQEVVQVFKSILQRNAQPSELTNLLHELYTQVVYLLDPSSYLLKSILTVLARDLLSFRAAQLFLEEEDSTLIANASSFSVALELRFFQLAFFFHKEIACNKFTFDYKICCELLLGERFAENGSLNEVVAELRAIAMAYQYRHPKPGVLHAHQTAATALISFLSTVYADADVLLERFSKDFSFPRRGELLRGLAFCFYKLPVVRAAFEYASWRGSFRMDELSDFLLILQLAVAMLKHLPKLSDPTRVSAEHRLLQEVKKTNFSDDDYKQILAQKLQQHNDRGCSLM